MRNVQSWDLAAAAIVVRIRWFGLFLGYFYANYGPRNADLLLLNAILTLGLVYTIADTFSSWKGRVFLGRYPLFISLIESIFISLLCYFEGELESPFRFYYLLSILCCAIRYHSSVTYATLAFDCLSYVVLFYCLPLERRQPYTLVSTIIILIWVNWAASAMSRLLKQFAEKVTHLNAALQENQTLLESRIEEGTRELQESQAQVMHQDKMASFGLLAAGVAHEVGNPMTSISGLIQILEKRELDDYTRDKLKLVRGQMTRIQGILRELVHFSRPANPQRSRCSIAEIVDEALKIAKYYKGTPNRVIVTEIAPQLPQLYLVKDQMIQIVFNLVINAIDATDRGGRIEIRAEANEKELHISVQDNGTGINPEQQERIFRPYFTTKKNGTGLGLFVIKKMIEDHQGEIQFQSTPEDGTTFRIRFPVPPVKNETPFAVLGSEIVTHKEVNHVEPG